MRKVQQAKILELLQTLKEANDELKKQTSSEVICDLLAGMQDFALQIGQYIELVAGKETKAVVLLEEFCSTIYEAYKNQNAPKYIKWLKSQLRYIENTVQNELKPDKIEIVFLPYQLSMWDSLESIYTAAKADPGCDVYVVPIPWFDKKTNGEFGKMHYDGDQYPAHIPITNWQDYDVETRHPDIIYIHNCYDNGNYVTSVHTDFYSKRLRECTDLLIYVPYFVVAFDIPEYLCTTAGCCYAHKVIAQSKNIRDTYVRIFKQNFGNQFGKPEDKFVALGSPKFDKILNTKREYCELPEEWKKRIDGKKVVLYNTSLNSILHDTEQYLKMIRRVLKTFRKWDNMVLWWRPHPLIENTLRSMRPELLKEYYEIVAEFQNDGLNIFDQSPELHRAITMSDIYFGDIHSSLVALYQFTEKPIQILDIDKMKDVNVSIFDDVSVCIGDIIYVDQYTGWAFDLFSDALLQINMKTKQAKIATQSNTNPMQNGIPVGNTHRYITIRLKGGKVICFPYYLYDIFIFDIETKEKRHIYLDKSFLNNKKADGFGVREVIEFQDKFYCFCIYTSTILIFDILNETVEYMNILNDNLSLENSSFEHDVPIVLNYDKKGNVMLLCQHSCIVFVINLFTKESCIIAKNTAVCGFSVATYFEETIWLLHPQDNALIKWSLKNNTTQIYYYSEDRNLSTRAMSYPSLINWKNHVILLPGWASKMISFNKDTELFENYTDLPVPDDLKNEVYKYEAAKYCNNKIYLFARFQSTVYELDCTTKEMSLYTFKLDYWEYHLLGNNKEIHKALPASNAGNDIYEYTKSLVMR